MSITISYFKRIICHAILALFLVGLLGCYANDAMEYENDSSYYPNTLPPSIMVDDILYYLAGYTVDIDVEADEYLGEITSTVRLSALPSKNGQSNFAPEGTPYVKHEDGIAIFMEDSWLFFKARNN